MSLTLGSQTYSKKELLKILNTANGNGNSSDASLTLADQLIAAKLSIANGSDPSPVADAVTNGDNLLSAYSGKLPYKVKRTSVAGQNMVSTANTLEIYNMGELTPGCAAVQTGAWGNLGSFNDFAAIFLDSPDLSGWITMSPES